MGVVPLNKIPGVVVGLGRPHDQILVTTVRPELVEVEFGPDNRYRTTGLVFSCNDFSIGMGKLNVNNLHQFGPADWLFVQRNVKTLELITNEHFVCPSCRILSGKVTGVEPGETGEDVHVIECQECYVRLYPQIAQTA